MDFQTARISIDDDSFSPRIKAGDHLVVQVRDDVNVGDEVLLRLKNGMRSVGVLQGSDEDFTSLRNLNSADVVIYENSDIVAIYYIVEIVRAPLARN